MFQIVISLGLFFVTLATACQQIMLRNLISDVDKLKNNNQPPQRSNNIVPGSVFDSES
jgi:hypothetical protein